MWFLQSTPCRSCSTLQNRKPLSLERAILNLHFDAKSSFARSVRYDRNQEFSLAYCCCTQNNLSNGIKFIEFGEEKFEIVIDVEELELCEDDERFWIFHALIFFPWPRAQIVVSRRGGPIAHRQHINEVLYCLGLALDITLLLGHLL